MEATWWSKFPSDKPRAGRLRALSLGMRGRLDHRKGADTATATARATDTLKLSEKGRVSSERRPWASLPYADVLEGTIEEKGMFRR